MYAPKGSMIRLSFKMADATPTLDASSREYNEVNTALSASFDGHNYRHDVGVIRKSASALDGGAKRLQKLQKSLSQKKTKNKNKVKEDYNVCVSAMRQELTTLQEVLNIKEQDLTNDYEEMVLQNASLRSLVEEASVDEIDCIIENQGNEATVEEEPHDDVLCRLKELENLVDRHKMETKVEQAEKEEALDRLKRVEKMMDKAITAKEDALMRLERQRLEIEAERQGKVAAENRLSKIISNQQGSKAMSDETNHIKVCGQLCELYNKEWADAFKELTKTKPEKEAIEMLLELMMETYRKCLSLSSVEKIMKIVEEEFKQIPTHTHDNLLKRLVEIRKETADNSLKEITEKIKVEIEREKCKWVPSESVITYVEACIKFNWFIAIQDPLLYLSQKLSKTFDHEVYEVYTESGEYTSFVVWPALYHHEGGPLLQKGVAQGYTPENGSLMTISPVTVLNEIKNTESYPKSTTVKKINSMTGTIKDTNDTVDKNQIAEIADVNEITNANPNPKATILKSIDDTSDTSENANHTKDTNERFDNTTVVTVLNKFQNQQTNKKSIILKNLDDTIDTSKNGSHTKDTNKTAGNTAEDTVLNTFQNAKPNPKTTILRKIDEMTKTNEYVKHTIDTNQTTDNKTIDTVSNKTKNIKLNPKTSILKKICEINEASKTINDTKQTNKTAHNTACEEDFLQKPNDMPADTNTDSSMKYKNTTPSGMKATGQHLKLIGKVTRRNFTLKGSTKMDETSLITTTNNLNKEGEKKDIKDWQETLNIDGNLGNTDNTFPIPSKTNTNVKLAMKASPMNKVNCNPVNARGNLNGKDMPLYTEHRQYRTGSNLSVNTKLLAKENKAKSDINTRLRDILMTPDEDFCKQNKSTETASIYNELEESIGATNGDKVKRPDKIDEHLTDTVKGGIDKCNKNKTINNAIVDMQTVEHSRRQITITDI